MLTPQQRRLLLYIHERTESDGITPSYDEMKDALKLRSKSGIHRLIKALEERGYIRRLAHRARAIDVIRLPPAIVPKVSVATAQSIAMPAKLGNGQRGHGAPPAHVPMMGRIAAGLPREAIEDFTHNIDIDPAVFAAGDVFALEVVGDSMIDAGIAERDTVFLQRCDSANNGDIVVALIQGEEATLKRLRRRGQSIALEAANPAYETRIFGPDQVQIQGKLVGLLRYFP